MKTTDDNGLSELWSAEKVNERTLFDMWHECPYFRENKTERKVECVVPDAETAKAYIEARHIRECCYGGTPYLLDRHYTSEEVRDYSEIEDRIRETHPDMRDQIFTGANGKKGLRDVCGKVLIEPQFDDIPELYTCFERTSLIPVVLDGRYYLYDIKAGKILTKGYDRIFRYFWANFNYFVAVENGKKGILDGYNGAEVTPVDLDEVYEMLDNDGAVPYIKDGKIGFVWGNTDTKPVFNKVVIESENYTRVLMNGEWGWIDSDGKFTSERSEASFGSWYDLDK